MLRQIIEMSLLDGSEVSVGIVVFEVATHDCPGL